MQTIKSIMVAVDLSDDSLPSLECASQLASSLDAKLILANIFSQNDVDAFHRRLKAYYGYLYFESMVESNLNARRDRLAQLAALARVEDRVQQQIVRMGSPCQELFSIVKEERPDLLITTRKENKNLIGALTRRSMCKVCRNFPVPVLNL